MADLQFNIVLTGQWMVDNESLWAMESCFYDWKDSHLQQGSAHIP